MRLYILTILSLLCATMSVASAQSVTATTGDNQKVALVRENGRLVAHFAPVTFQWTSCGAYNQCPSTPINFTSDARAGQVMEIVTAGNLFQSSGLKPLQAGLQVNADTQGKVTLSTVNIYDAAGSATLIAYKYGSPGYIAHLTALPENVSNIAGATLAITSGNNQKVARPGGVLGGTAFFGPLGVKLLRPDGSPLAGASIVFGCRPAAGMSCQVGIVNSLARTSITVLTDANGVALLDSYTGGKSLTVAFASGAFTVTAAYNSTTQTFNLDVP